MYMYREMYVYRYMHMCMHMYMYMYVYTYRCMYVCMRVWAGAWAGADHIYIYMYVCIYIYIYMHYRIIWCNTLYYDTFNLIDDLWISNLHWTVGFPGPRWMHVPKCARLGRCVSSRCGHSAQGLRYCRVKALPNQPYMIQNNITQYSMYNVVW